MYSNFSQFKKLFFFLSEFIFIDLLRRSVEVDLLGGLHCVAIGRAHPNILLEFLFLTIVHVHVFTVILVQCCLYLPVEGVELRVCLIIFHLNFQCN